MDLRARLSLKIVSQADTIIPRCEFAPLQVKDEQGKTLSSGIPLIFRSRAFLIPGAWKDQQILEDKTEPLVINSYAEWNQAMDRHQNTKFVTVEQFINGEMEAFFWEGSRFDAWNRFRIPVVKRVEGQDSPIDEVRDSGLEAEA